MPKVIIADTSCLIVLAQIGELNVLKEIYSEVLITPEIEEEFKDILPSWVKVIEVEDKKRQNILELELDRGEASAIALCLEQEECLLIIDERKGRSIAKKLNIKITGTLGILLKAKELGIIFSISEVIGKLEKFGFWMSDTLKEKVLKQAKEK